MNGSVRLGFWIAALFAAGVFAVYLFGNHESWFVRAAQDGAAGCLTASPCTQVQANGTLTLNAKPPLGADSICGARKGWKELRGVSNGQTSIVLTCTDGRTYLYHMGVLKDRKAGDEQWMVCRTKDCPAEIDLLKNLGRG